MLIAFCGNDGSGKSTQVRRVAQHYRDRGRPVEILDKWDILDANRFPECRFIDTPLDDLRICIAEMEGPARAMFLFWSIALTISKARIDDGSRVYLLDGYWMKHAAAEIRYGADRQWIERTVAQLPRADVTFYFDVEPATALARKPSLTPYECGRSAAGDAASFLRHQSAVRETLLSWASRDGWICAPPGLDRDQTTAFVADALERHG